jgi:hypothetical protein
MALPNQPTMEEINKYLYLVDDQHLYWKPRDVSEFTTEWASKKWNGRRAHKIAGYTERNGRLTVRLKGALYRADYIIYALYHQRLSTQELRHADGDISNNYIDNLVPHEYTEVELQEKEGFGKTYISVDYLKECFSLLPDGILVWRKRPQSHFCSVNAHNTWNSRYAGTICGSKGNSKIHVVLSRRRLAAHRVVWAMHYGEWPNGIIDHLDGNPHNNNINNLRDTTLGGNSKNARRRSNNKSGYSGLYLDKRRGTWYIRINTGNDNEMHQSGFATKEEAIEARHKAYKQLGFTERHGI